MGGLTTVERHDRVKGEHDAMKKRLVCLAVLAAGFVLAAEDAPANPPKERVVFVCAHPDDLAGPSGTAILLARKFDVHVIDYTHGEGGCGKEGFLDGSTRRKRTHEEEEACAVAGVTLHWLDEPNGHVEWGVPYCTAGRSHVARPALQYGTPHEACPFGSSSQCRVTPATAQASSSSRMRFCRVEPSRKPSFPHPPSPCV